MSRFLLPKPYIICRCQACEGRQSAASKAWRGRCISMSLLYEEPILQPPDAKEPPATLKHTVLFISLGSSPWFNHLRPELPMICQLQQRVPGLQRHVVSDMLPTPSLVSGVSFSGCFVHPLPHLPCSSHARPRSLTVAPGAPVHQGGLTRRVGYSVRFSWSSHGRFDRGQVCRVKSVCSRAMAHRSDKGEPQP